MKGAMISFARAMTNFWFAIALEMLVPSEPELNSI